MIRLPLLRRLRPDEASLLLTVLLALGIHALVRPLFTQAARLAPADYEGALIVAALVADPWRLLLVLAPAVLLAATRTAPRWTDIVGGAALRTFVLSLVGVLAWWCATHERDPYFDRFHGADRLLVVALAVACWWTPLLVPAFALVALAVVGQIDAPLGGDWTDWRIVADLLVLFGAWHLASLRRTARAGHFVFLVLCLVGVNYFYQGVYKLALEPAGAWVTDNRLANLFVVSHGRGWLTWVEDGTVVAIADVLRALQVPSALGVLALELAGLAFLLRRRVTVALLIACVLLHAAIFALSGIFFWKWIVLDLGLVLLLLRLPEEELAALWLPRVAGPLAGAAVVLGLSWIFQPPYLAWWDSPLDQTYEVEAVDARGDGHVLPSWYFAPHDKLFAQARFFAADPGWNLAGTYGTVGRHDVFVALQRARGPEEVRALGLRAGASRFHPAFARQLDDFLARWFAGLNRRGRPAPRLALLSPPRHIWSSRGERDPRPELPIARVRVWRVVEWFDGRRVHELERALVTEVVVPDGGP